MSRALPHRPTQQRCMAEGLLTDSRAWEQWPFLDLYFRFGDCEALTTDAGRRAIAARYRRQYVHVREQYGLEPAGILRQAELLENADWPQIAKMLTAGEHQRWNAIMTEQRREHRGVLELARALAKIPKGEDP